VKIVSGDGDNLDVFRYDRRARETDLVSVGFDSQPTGATSGAPSISGDGSVVAYVSDGATSSPTRTRGRGPGVRPGDGRRSTSPGQRGPRWRSERRVRSPAISADGKVVAFESAAPNLVANDGNGAPDVFRRDLARARRSSSR
jgi:Tol biopolymer transport system component